MSVPTKLGESKFRGLRRGHAARTTGRQVHAPSAPGATPDRSRAKRLGGYAQDNAVYNCECGMVFEAAVSTAVSCPNCGSHQAW